MNSVNIQLLRYIQTYQSKSKLLSSSFSVLLRILDSSDGPTTIPADIVDSRFHSNHSIIFMMRYSSSDS